MPKTDALSGLPRPAYGDKRSHRALVTLAGAAISRDKPVELADHVSASPYEGSSTRGAAEAVASDGDGVIFPVLQDRAPTRSAAFAVSR
jgi:hypothetical protein